MPSDLNALNNDSLKFPVKNREKTPTYRRDRPDLNYALTYLASFLYDIVCYYIGSTPGFAFTVGFNINDRFEPHRLVCLRSISCRGLWPSFQKCPETAG